MDKWTPECCNDSVEEEFTDIWEQALDDDLFMEVKFPKFEILIDSGNELNCYHYYDLVQLNKDFRNSSVTLYKVGHLIHYIPEGGHSSIYYPIVMN